MDTTMVHLGYYIISKGWTQPFSFIQIFFENFLMRKLLIFNSQSNLKGIFIYFILYIINKY